MEICASGWFIHDDQTNHNLSTDIQQEVLKRLKDYGGTKQHLAHDS